MVVEVLVDEPPGGLAAVGVLEAEAGGELRVVDLDGRLGAAGDGAGSGRRAYRAVVQLPST